MTLEQSKPNARSLNSIKICCTKSAVDAQVGCNHAPLIDVELDHVVIDELHLLLTSLTCSSVT